MRTGFKIRQDFIKYFETQKHTIVPSSSLVPLKDPSLLFTRDNIYIYIRAPGRPGDV